MTYKKSTFFIWNIVIICLFLWCSCKSSIKPVKCPKHMNFIIQLKNTSDPTCDTLHLFEENNNHPICSIYEHDFCNLLSERQLEKYETGWYKFNLQKDKVLEKSIKIY